MCLMPLCDSIRLKKPVITFPFWKLQENVYDAVSAQRRGVVVFSEAGEPSALAASGKPRDMLTLIGFRVDQGRQDVAAHREEGVFSFSAINEDVEWVGQLKPLHAQRIAHDVAQNFSRVGLSEAEWLRLLCDRSSSQ